MRSGSEQRERSPPYLQGNLRSGAARIRSRNHHAVPRSRRVVGCRHRRLDQLVIRGEMTDGVSAGGVAGEREGLATTAAEVDFATVATAARVRHPFVATELLEQWRLRPDPLKRVLAHVGAGQAEPARQLVRRWARQRFAVGYHGELAAGPAVHAG